MPETFGRYELHGELGRGGMGEVYRAFDTVRERTVALKLLPHHLAADDSFQARFRRESRLAAKLNEPHIIPIHDFGEVDGQLFIDMRLVEGRDLGWVLEHGGPLDVPRAVSVISQVAAALDAAHDSGLVHRDVKPSNVLLTGWDAQTRDGDPFAYLVDFGIARASGSEGTSLTATSGTVGTVAYMAPERIGGEPGDRRADVYSLACMLFEALTGRKPFDGEAFAVMYAHMHSEPPNASAGTVGVPAALDEVIRRGMAKDADYRYATASEFARAVREASRVRIAAPAPPPPPTGHPIAFRRPESGGPTHSGPTRSGPAGYPATAAPGTHPSGPTPGVHPSGPTPLQPQPGAVAYPAARATNPPAGAPSPPAGVPPEPPTVRSAPAYLGSAPPPSAGGHPSGPIADGPGGRHATQYSGPTPPAESARSPAAPAQTPASTGWVPAQLSQGSSPAATQQRGPSGPPPRPGLSAPIPQPPAHPSGPLPPGAAVVPQPGHPTGAIGQPRPLTGPLAQPGADQAAAAAQARRNRMLLIAAVIAAAIFAVVAISIAIAKGMSSSAPAPLQQPASISASAATTARTF